MEGTDGVEATGTEAVEANMVVVTPTGDGVGGGGASILALVAPAVSLKHLEHMYPV